MIAHTSLNNKEIYTIMVIFNLFDSPYIDCLNDNSISNWVIVLLNFANLIKSSFGTIFHHIFILCSDRSVKLFSFTELVCCPPETLVSQFPFLD